MSRSTLLATGYVALLAFSVLPAFAADDSAVPATPHQDEVLRGAQQTDTPAGAVGDIECGMPASPHQQEVLGQNKPEGGADMQPRADMPATPHQQQVLRGGDDEGRVSLQVPTEEGMPASPHQQQVLKRDGTRQAGEEC